jgi:hypothetical protein
MGGGRHPTPRAAMASSGSSGRLGGIIVLIGAILLIAALFTPWYIETSSEHGESISVNAYPGTPGQNGTIKYTCSGFPSGFSCPTQTSYSSENLNSTGMIAEYGFFLVLVGIVFGILAALLGLISGGNPKRARPAMALAVLALILALVAPAMFAAALPGAIANDTKDHPSGSGPWSSFIGSGNISGLNLTWGPGVGWYLTIGAFVLFLIGVILLWRARKAPAAAAPATPAAPATSDASGGATSPPPMPPST